MAKQNSKKRKKLIIFGGLGLLVLIIVVLVITSSNKEEIISVQTETISKRTITQIVRATGKIHPVEQVVLRAEVTGEIVELPVKEGDKVRKGQLLVRLKPEQYVARRNQALASLNSAKSNLKVREATLTQVESEYKRIQGMYDKGLASDKELEVAKSNFLQNKGFYESQKASVTQSEEEYKYTEVELSKTAIYAPLDGIVTTRPVELSERVSGSSFSPGTHLLTVADLNSIEARVNVNENDIVMLAKGDTAKIEIDAFDKKLFKGVVTQIGNSAKETGVVATTDQVVNFEVRIRLIELDEKIRPGMSCDADIETETKYNVLAVPIQSVTARLANVEEKVEVDEDQMDVTSSNKVEKKKDKPKEIVFIANNGKAKKVEIETGISDDDYYEVKKGLTGNETVISGPYRAISKELDEGSKIIVQKKTKKEDKK